MAFPASHLGQSWARRATIAQPCREPECAPGMGRSPHPSLDRARCGFRQYHPLAGSLLRPRVLTTSKPFSFLKKITEACNLCPQLVPRQEEELLPLQKGLPEFPKQPGQAESHISAPCQAALRLSGHAISWSCRRPSWARSQPAAISAVCNFTSRVSGHPAAGWFRLTWWLLVSALHSF